VKAHCAAAQAGQFGAFELFTRFAFGRRRQNLQAGFNFISRRP